MTFYQIRSGDMERIVSADDWESACVLAVKEENNSEKPGSLGLVLEILEVAEAEPSYTATESICRKAGLWRDD
jgi:hypothetical protein